MLIRLEPYIGSVGVIAVVALPFLVTGFALRFFGDRLRVGGKYPVLPIIFAACALLFIILRYLSRAGYVDIPTQLLGGFAAIVAGMYLSYRLAQFLAEAVNSLLGRLRNRVPSAEPRKASAGSLGRQPLMKTMGRTKASIIYGATVAALLAVAALSTFYALSGAVPTREQLVSIIGTPDEIKHYPLSRNGPSHAIMIKDEAGRVTGYSIEKWMDHLMKPADMSGWRKSDRIEITYLPLSFPFLGPMRGSAFEIKVGGRVILGLDQSMARSDQWHNVDRGHWPHSLWSIIAIMLFAVCARFVFLEVPYLRSA